MLAKDRVFAIRAGTYTSSDIKEASFNYGYISGDTFKPGGTVAGSAKLTFTSIITTFNKLDKISPEIGLLVGDSYEWVAMGEYFVNDISIDRNRNTTELDLMDGMFKLNQPYVSDLTYPAQIRDVIREICVKTGVELETDNLGLRAIQRHIEAKADKKDITFREVLSQAIQLLGFSAFFNRRGKLEIRGLTDSRITVTADNYFLHGLTKSEIQYQIAGITCKKDKETLTVGLRTGRSLELENSFMNQNLLDDLYYDLKEIKYYPFSLDWQGHLKLDVGQWVTLKTNKNETYKVPVLSQSFNFRGGLKSKISADSKAGNDTQYSYKGFLTKQIEQMSTQIDAEIQQQLEYANAEFDRKAEEYRKELDNGIEQAKVEAERHADQIKTEISQEFDAFEQEYQVTKQSQGQQIADILAKAQAVESLANQAKTDAASAIQRSSQLKEEAVAEANRLVQAQSAALTERIQAVDIRVDDVANQISSKVSQIDFDAVKKTVESNSTAITQNQSVIELKADKTVTDALATAVDQTKSELKITSDAVATKVSKTDFDAANQRLATAETTIRTQAGQIEQRLTSKQVESAITSKGYQTKSDVDSNITSRGYITSSALQPYALSTTVQNLVQETADSFSRTLSETKALIPTEVGGRNYLLNSKTEISGGWGSKVISLSPELLDNLNKIKSVTISCDVEGTNVATKNSRKRFGLACSVEINGIVNYWEVWQARDTIKKRISRTFTVPEGKTITKFYSPSLWIQADGDIKVSNPKLEFGVLPTDWSPAPEDLATITALHSVRDTVDSHTRTIGAVGTNGSILDNISKVTQTAAGLVQEVSGTNGLKTQVSTLAGSWAVKNLNSDGDILSQANLSPDSFLLEAAKIRLKGKTLADEIQAIDGKFNTLFVSDGTFGKLDAKIIGARAITGNQIKFDQGFFDNFAANEAYLGQLFAKNIFSTKVQAVQLSATQLTSGIIKSFNERTTLDLLTGKLTFKNGSPSIEFNSNTSAIRRVTDAQSQFIKFASKDGGTYTTIGASRVALDELIGTATFTGIQIQSRSAERGGLIDRIYAYADEFIVDGGGGQVDGFVFKNREALYPQSSGMIGLGRIGDRWKNVYAFDYYVGQNAVSLKEFLDAVRACFQQIAYGGMTQTTYTLIQSKLSSTFNKIQ
ncbi:TPA: hypothetical protein ACGO7Y_001259 [Streptococcus suis]